MTKIHLKMKSNTKIGYQNESKPLQLIIFAA